MIVKHSIQAYIYVDGDGYVAQCADLNVVTQGDDLDQTLANLKEAIALALDGEDSADFNLVPDPPILVTIELEPLSHAS